MAGLISEKDGTFNERRDFEVEEDIAGKIGTLDDLFDV